MSRLLVLLLVFLGFVLGARAVLILGAKKFRGTLLGQVLQSIRAGAGQAPQAGAREAKPGTALMKCSVCRTHVPTPSAGPATGFVCERCLGQRANS